MRVSNPAAPEHAWRAASTHVALATHISYRQLATDTCYRQLLLNVSAPNHVLSVCYKSKSFLIPTGELDDFLKHSEMVLRLHDGYGAAKVDLGFLKEKTQKKFKEELHPQGTLEFSVHFEPEDLEEREPEPSDSPSGNALPNVA